MKYAIIYDSKGGNTKLLAETIKKVLDKEECVYFGNGEDFNPTSCDFIFLGSWCDKGTISDTLISKLSKLSHKQVAVFGSCGFGGSQQYFEDVAKRMCEKLPTNSKTIDTFICQGKMPLGIRKRYEKMLNDPTVKDMAENFITNFDNALSHPDSNDLKQIEIFAKQCIEKVKAHDQ